MEQIKHERIKLKFMLYSCCICSGSSKSMNYYSKIFALSASLILSLCHIWKLIAIKNNEKFSPRTSAASFTIFSLLKKNDFSVTVFLQRETNNFSWCPSRKQTSFVTDVNSLNLRQFLLFTMERKNLRSRSIS